MLLALDIGNSNIVLGLLDGDDVRFKERLETRPREDAARARARLEQVLPPKERATIDGVVLATVVLPLAPVFAEALEALTGKPVLVVDHLTSTGVRLDVDAPAEVGADRFVNLAALVGRGTEGALVVDFGTATTIDVLSPDDAFLGGAIAPGLATTADALRARAPRLPAVPLSVPASAIGRNTTDALRVGVVLGYAALIDGLISRMRSELPFPVRVYATGGLAPFVASHCASIDVVDEDLTLRGLARIHARSSRERLTAAAPAM